MLYATLAAARAAPLPPGRRSALLMRRGSMQLRFYAPRGEDLQTPHEQDELYIVMRGRGEFVCDNERTTFDVGDVLFARARAEHRFERFSDDLEVWVVFWGPEGGES